MGPLKIESEKKDEDSDNEEVIAARAKKEYEK